MDKLTRNRAATTNLILNAFEQVLADEGIDSVSVTQIAEKAGVSKVLIYRYFGSLEGLSSYYIESGRVLPQYTPGMLEQLKPTQQKDMVGFWSTAALQPFRRMRTSASARQLLKVAVQGDDPIHNTVSQSLDQEFSKLVHQLSLVRGGDHESLSALVLGGLSYLTIQAQLDRPVLGMDLRGEGDWQRIEEAVRTICQALVKLAGESSVIQWELELAEANFIMS